MWDKSYDLHFLTMHSPLLGKQHIKISGWCSATFIFHFFLIKEKTPLVFQLQYYCKGQ